MRQSYFQLFDEPSGETEGLARSLGYASLLLSRNPSHFSLPIRYINDMIFFAISNRKIRYFFNHDGDVVAYIAWAFIGEDVERKVIRDGRFDLHLSEWDEGTSLWIVDLLAPYGHVKNVISWFRNNVSLGQRVRYFRLRKRVLYCRESCGVKPGAGANANF